MIFHAHHGYYQAERELGQKFEVDFEKEGSLYEIEYKNKLISLFKGGF